MAKKKEKVLTKEEWQYKFKIELENFWHHTDPEFAVVPNGDRYGFFPLNEKIENQIILLFHLDILDYTTERAFELIELWKVRFKGLNFRSILVFQKKYAFLDSSRFFERYRTGSTFMNCPVYLDPNGEVKAAMKSDSSAAVAILNRMELKSMIPLSAPLGKSIVELEMNLHQVFRERDPGLPLPLIYEYEITAPVDQEIILLSKIPKKGFWNDSETQTFTDDPKASFMIPLEGKAVRFAADLHPKAVEGTKVVVTLDHQPIPESQMGKSVKVDEKGRTVIEISRQVGIFDVFKSDTVRRGILHFEFPGVFENPVILYELRVAL